MHLGAQFKIPNSKLLIRTACRSHAPTHKLIKYESPTDYADLHGCGV